MKESVHPLSFRFAHEGDADALTAIYVTAMTKTCHIDNPQEQYRSKHMDLTKRITQNPNEILVAVQDNKAVAYIMHSVPISSLPDHLHIDDFYVAEPKTGTGAQTFKMFCKLHGEASTLHLTNRSYASDVYESFGFELETAKDMTMPSARLKLWRENIGRERPRFPVKGFTPESGM